MNSTRARVAVLGAYGHTGQFIVAELRRRGLVPILAGRDAERLRALGAAHPGVVVRVATVDDAGSLDRALTGAEAVINAAGPFCETAAPVISAAVRAGIPYLDVTAETEVVLDTVAAYGDQARAAGITVVPAVAFYGGLGDLLVSAAMDDWLTAERISIAYALSSWWPTEGTRKTGRVSARRRGGARIRYADHRLQVATGDAPVLPWTFPPPVGTRAVVAEFTMADSATIPTHLTVKDIDTYMTVEAVTELRAADTPTPVAVDESGRSDQTFLVDVVVSSAGSTRNAVARGRDIYAISAPLVVEAACRVLANPMPGVHSVGALGDARDILGALHPRHLTVELPDR
jgi:hypothetical protein